MFAIRGLKHYLLLGYFVALNSVCFTLHAQPYARYGEHYCDKDGFSCIKVQRGESWQSLWPDEEERDIVQRLNRMNVALQPGMVIAIPKNLAYLDIYDISPLPLQMETNGEKIIVVNQRDLAWGAYDHNGQLQHWGPISSGKNYCPDVNRGCRTITGTFKIYHKRGSECISSKYPVGRGGAKMPHCMFFHGGYAMHGSPEVPGYRASHGCIRLFNHDAHWLNTKFIDLPSKDNSSGTTVIIQPL